MIFVDPKGIRNIGPTDPKIQFYETIKEIEQRLGDPNVVLESFIVSNTPSHMMRMLWGMEKAEMPSGTSCFRTRTRMYTSGPFFARQPVGGMTCSETIEL